MVQNFHWRSISTGFGRKIEVQNSGVHHHQTLPPPNKKCPVPWNISVRSAPAASAPEPPVPVKWLAVWVGKILVAKWRSTIYMCVPSWMAQQQRSSSRTRWCTSWCSHTSRSSRWLARATKMCHDIECYIALGIGSAQDSVPPAPSVVAEYHPLRRNNLVFRNGRSLKT